MNLAANAMRKKALSGLNYSEIFAWIVLLSWLSQTPYLLSMPSGASGKAVETFLWEDWSLRAAMIAFGVAASVLALKRHRLWLAGVFLTSLAYVIYWWLFSGYFTVDVTLGELSRGLWMKAQAPGYMLITVHRDFLLLSFYHLVVVSICNQTVVDISRGH